MDFWLAVTDNAWFGNLAALRPDEVAFWHPSGRGFGAIEPGAPFLFKLKSPNNHVAGGGNFTINAKAIPLRLAWDAFKEKIGANTFEGFRDQIAQSRREPADVGYNPDISLTVISNPFFFERQSWIPAPNDWASGIQTGKVYSTLVEPGASIWREVRARIEGVEVGSSHGYAAEPTLFDRSPLGKEYLRRARVGQGAFRMVTIENFKHKCCITGETTSPVLQAAHIKPVSAEGQHSVQNALLLRADVHILYDQGLVAVDPNYHIKISPQIRSQYLNGRIYYSHDGEPLRSLPASKELRPDRDLLDWHMKTVFRR